MAGDAFARRLLLGGLLAALALTPLDAEAAKRKAKAQAAKPKAKGRPAPAPKPAAKPARQIEVRRQTRRPPAQVRQVTARTPRPQPAPLPVVVIDPGHGGRDPGAIGLSGTQEKHVTLAAALELKRQLDATGRYRVKLTRDDDSTVSLQERVAFARAQGAVLLISIHADASTSRAARGASVYIRPPSSGVRRVAPRPGAIASALAGEAGSSGWLRRVLIESLGEEIELTDDPAREGHLYVLGAGGMASVLLEMGFLSNRHDEAALRRPAHRRVIARAIRDAVEEYFERIRKTPGKRA